MKYKDYLQRPYCWAKLRGSRTLRCVRTKGHKGRHSRLHMVIASFTVTPEILATLKPNPNAFIETAGRLVGST